MTDTPELKPCPNPWGCAGRQPPVCTHADFDGDSVLRHVVCHSCGLRGPVRSTEAEAITAWNTRTADIEAGVIAELVEAAREIYAKHRGDDKSVSFHSGALLDRLSTVLAKIGGAS